MSDPSSGKPGRYQRSAGGLGAAMIILVVLVLGIVGYRSLFRVDADVEPSAVDYREAASAAATSGLPVVAPDSLPEGWIATSAALDPGRSPLWRVGMLTEGETFLGLRQAERGAESMLEDVYPDDEVVPGETAQVDTALGEAWQTFEIDDELAYAASFRGTTVLVNGPAAADELELLLERLVVVEAPGPQPSSSPDAS